MIVPIAIEETKDRRRSATTSELAVDLYETGECFVLVAFLGGVDQSELRLDVHERGIALLAPDGAALLRLALRSRCRPDGITALLARDHLTVTIPKRRASRARSNDLRATIR